MSKKGSGINPEGPIFDEDDKNSETSSLALFDEVDDPDSIDSFGIGDTNTAPDEYLGT